jgi:hypothetical protein
MNANDLAKISESIDNRKLLERVYEELLLPELKIQAEMKRRTMKVRGNSIPRISERVVLEKLESIGLKSNLQSLVEGELGLFLKEKGFRISTFSPAYLVEIHW